MTKMYGGLRNVRFQLDKMVARDYYGRDRQEVLLSQISKIPARLKKVGSRYELAIRVRPAKQWDDEYASSALAEYGLVYCGSIEPLATFDAESRIIICLTDDDTTAALEAGTDPTKWEGIAEMMRHQIASEQRTMLPWMKREWSNDIVNRLSLPGVSRGAANGVSARVIIPKSQDMEDLGPNINRVAVFQGYWGREPVVTALRKYAASFASVLAAGGPDSDTIESQIGNVYFGNDYSVGTREDHTETVFDSLADSLLGTVIREYKRPGARGSSTTAAEVCMPHQPVGPSYQESIRRIQHHK